MGFYVTRFRSQAEKWAERKALRQGGEAIVNVYEMNDQLTGYNVLDLSGDDSKWVDFVCSCRRGDKIYCNYDIITGGVADDEVFKAVDMYFKGLWDKDKTISELKYYKKNDQTAFISQKALDDLLTFRHSYKAGR